MPAMPTMAARQAGEIIFSEGLAALHSRHTRTPTNAAEKTCARIIERKSATGDDTERPYCWGWEKDY
ncbi:unnamed protein product [Strongylus vulgaris]|uniref:Uncharacterized protein n=1 Tax=Strongylus vulgaris TaxID=40348 RepID=A0A3P7IEC9_STRVU|nr:unnamed protein product [Strongylus vulgaris]